MYSIIDSCRICSSPDLQAVLNLGDQPPANSLRSDEKEFLERIPLALQYCSECRTAQLSATVDPSYLFSDYVWVTGTAATTFKYSEKFSAEVLRRTGASNPFVVEIASNDGTFLMPFKLAGCSVLGVDPAKNIVEQAVKKNIPTWPDFFNRDVAARIVAQHGRPKVVFARNVIPHVKEIHSIIQGISDLIDSSGTAVIEFHYAKQILDELHYDSIYHEHLFYFSIRSLSKLFERYGLFPFDLFESPISGGSLVVFFKKQEVVKTQTLVRYLDDEDKSGLNDIKAWRAFGESSIAHAQELFELVTRHVNASGRLVAYGASARSSTLLNFAGLDKRQIEFIIDRNPLKAGLITPGTDIPIVSYEYGTRELDQKNLLLLAWNFKDEIIRDLRDQGFRGDIVVPLPGRVSIK
jgi:hypothetical protein